MESQQASVAATHATAPREVYNFRVYAIAIIASMGAFLFGYDLAFIGTTITLEPFRKDFGLTHATEAQANAFSANIVSLLQAGCFFGSLVAGPVSDRYGRKLPLLFAGVIFCVGSVMQTASQGSRPAIFAGRAVGGLGVGAASMLVPVYVAELAPPAIRGRLVGTYEISVQTGTCIGFWIVYGVSSNMSASSAQWITPFAIQLIPGGLLILGMIFVPETPRWTAQYRGRTVAVEILAKLRNLSPEHVYVEEEMARIMDQIEQEGNATTDRGPLASLALATRKGYWNRILIGMTIFIFMQWAGSNAINYYSTSIFESIGLDGPTTGLYATGIYGIVRLVAIVIAMNFVVDRLGRTKMLMGGAAVMAFAMWFIGAYEKLHPNPGTGHISGAGYATVAMIYIFALGFCFSYAGVPWIYCSEIYPLSIRGVGMAACTATHWLFNFVIARSTPYMISNIKYGTFFVFASCTTLSIVFVYLCVPETKGRSIEDMDELFGVVQTGQMEDLESGKAIDYVSHRETTESSN